MRWLRLLMIFAALVASPHAFAVQPDEILKDPAQEARARELSKQLRCMVCQNQSIDDSDAPLARDLRILVRERLQAGDSNPQVLDFLVQRYGEFVLLRPRLHWRTALLWLAPLVLLIGGGLALFLLARRRSAGGSPDPALPQGGALTADEERRLASLMKSDDR
jgi:cytochrome c-type biogenesis protein CcmH